LGAGYGDQFENARIVWWTQYALQHGASPFYQSLLGYPDGFFSAAQWAQPLGYLPAAILSFITGPVAAVTLWTLIELVLNGLSAFVLCRALLAVNLTEKSSIQPAIERAGRWLAGLIGGLVFMAFPAMQGHLSAGHINVLALYGLPVYALCLWRITNGAAKWRTVLLGALMIVVTAAGDTDQAVYTLFPMTLFWLAYQVLWQRRTLWTRAVIGRLSLLFALGILFLVPFFAPLALQLSASDKTADLQQVGWVSYSTDPLSFVSLSPFTPWGSALAPTYARTVLGTNSTEGAAYLGIVVTALCLVGLLARTRRQWLPWLTVALGAAMFSLGPFLKWTDQPIVYTLGTYKSYLTLPWAVFQTLPILNASRTPGRFNLTTGLAVAVIAAGGMYVVLTRFQRRTIQLVITAALFVGIGVEYQLFAPTLTTSAAVPAYMTDLAQRSDVRAVFDIPWDDNLAAKDALYWQTVHHQPMIAGQALRTTPVDPAKLNVLQAAAIGNSSVPIALTVLDRAGVDVVIVHLSALPTTVSMAQINMRLGQPVFRDDRVVIYNVPKTPYQFGAKDTFSVLSLDRQTLSVYAPANGYVTFGNFPAGSGQSPALLTVDGQPAGLDSGWLHLTAGYHTVQRASAGGLPSDLATFMPEHSAPLLQLAQLLTFQAVGLSQSMSQLTVNTTWHFDQRSSADYHYFVHLVNAAGQLVGQVDEQPGGGLFPISQWHVGQDWTESTAFSLVNLPAGAYHIAVGWYSYPDMHRLTVDKQAAEGSDGLIDVGQLLIPMPNGYF
jgi:hypothetical protein